MYYNVLFCIVFLIHFKAILIYYYPWNLLDIICICERTSGQNTLLVSWNKTYIYKYETNISSLRMCERIKVHSHALLRVLHKPCVLGFSSPTSPAWTLITYITYIQGDVFREIIKIMSCTNYDPCCTYSFKSVELLSKLSHLSRPDRPAWICQFDRHTRNTTQCFDVCNAFINRKLLAECSLAVCKSVEYFVRINICIMMWCALCRKLKTIKTVWWCLSTLYGTPAKSLHPRR